MREELTSDALLEWAIDRRRRLVKNRSIDRGNDNWNSFKQGIYHGRYIMIDEVIQHLKNEWGAEASNEYVNI